MLYSTFICILSRNVLFLIKLEIQYLNSNDSIQGIASCLIFIQRLSIMFVATQLCLLHKYIVSTSHCTRQWLDDKFIFSTIGTLWKHSLLILSYQKICPFLLFFPPEDRDHTDSRRINNFVILVTFNHYFSNSRYCSDYVIINLPIFD